MQINFTGHHVEITDALRSYANQKMEKLHRYNEDIRAIDVVMTVEKLRQIAEATVQLDKNDFRAHAKAESEDMYHAIDHLVTKLSKQLAKHKEKVRTH